MSTVDQFRRNGYSLCRPLFERDDLSEIQRMIRDSAPHEPCLWSKDLAACDANILNVARHSAIISRLQPLLGEHFVLWGACCLKREPGRVHPWHTDIESSRPEGGFVSVWIGLEGTNQASALKLLPGSHVYGKSLQEVMRTHDATRDTTRDGDVREWAEHLVGGSCEVVQPSLADGDAIFFDGRLWHSSANDDPDTTRHCLVLQYASSDAPVRCPDFSQLSWPFRFLENPRPPCIAIHGESDPCVNSLVELPPELDATISPLDSGVHAVDCNAAVPPGKRRLQHHFLDGWTGNLQRMRSHCSVLQAGVTPHPPHSHVDEELLIVVSGEATLHYDDGSGAIADHRVSAGDGVYYPAFHRHTIHNHGDSPVVYLMYKWIATRTRAKEPLALQRFAVQPIVSSELTDQGYSKRVCFDGATHHLKRLECHISTLLPDGGYDAHVDEHDVALLIIEGRVETLDRIVSAGEFAWYSSGDPHGMHNPGPDPARYIVFEFHGEGCSGDYTTYRKPKASRSLIKKRSRRIAKKFKRILNRRS